MRMYQATIDKDGEPIRSPDGGVVFEEVEIPDDYFKGATWLQDGVSVYKNGVKLTPPDGKGQSDA